MSPKRVEIEVAPGKQATFELRVRPTTDELTRVKLAVSEFGIDSLGVFRTDAGQGGARSARTFTEVSPAALELPPGGVGKVTVTVKAPAGIDGSYLSGVLFHVEPVPQKDSLGNELQVAASVAVPVVVTAAGTEKPGFEIVGTSAWSLVRRSSDRVPDRREEELLALTAEERAAASGPGFELTTDVRNTGNTLLDLAGALWVESEAGGKEIARLAISDALVPPGARLTLRTPFPRLPRPPGSLKVRVMLASGTGDGSAKEATFSNVAIRKQEYPTLPARTILTPARTLNAVRVSAVGVELDTGGRPAYKVGAAENRLIVDLYGVKSAAAAPAPASAPPFRAVQVISRHEKPDVVRVILELDPGTACVLEETDRGLRLRPSRP